MVLSSPCLQAFVEPVPLCAATAPLTVALAALGAATGEVATTAYDRLVLVDEQHQPIGWVSARHLVACLVTSGLLDQLTAVGDRRKPAADLPLQDITPSIVEPLVVVEGALAIDAFLPQLHAHPHACYALVNADGSVLGLLNHGRLLQFVATRSAGIARPLPPSPLTVAPVATAPLALSRSSPPDPLLYELLEHLPLPVMLQTHDGQVLAQNSIWRTQISELLDPGWLRQEVATLLEMPLDDTGGMATQVDRVWSSLEPPFTTVAHHDAWMARSPIPSSTLEVRHLTNDSTESVPPSASSCQLGSKPGTCICVCSLKDGQEQVLQFVRIPLGTLSSLSGVQTGVRRRDRAQTIATTVESECNYEASPSQLFRLAALLSTVHNAVDFPQEQTVESLDDLLSLVDRASSATSPVSASEELWLILAQDVTEQQQLARELTAKNADLVQLNRLKDEFLACISHELRTPLTAVVGLSSLLKDQALGVLNQRQAHYAQLIYQSGRHLMAVVNDILDLTRIETGQLELVLEPVDLATVCDRAFEQAQQLRLQESSQTTTETDVGQPTFSLTLEPALGLLVADEQRLRQMLVHLLSNALKFTEANDPIGLKVGHWGGWIALTVWDTGIGIAADKQHLIFQKFQQLENPLTRRFEGTGLGLVLTQRLARLHGGDVTFISKEGEGSQFTILLPPHLPGTPDSTAVADASQRLEAPASQAAERSRHMQAITPIAGRPASEPMGDYALDFSALQRSQLVLIVEAAPQGIEALSAQLTGLGYRVVIARSGTEALEKARRLQPCVIFLNPVLPLLSGWDVLTLLKSNAETQHLPVVITATKVDEKQARQRQADSLLSLPVQPKALHRCLQQVVDRPVTLHPRTVPALTVLRLTPGVWSHDQQPLPTANLETLLHSCQYRILEADDLEQAELLARVWKPNVVLLDGVLADGAAYFRQYSQHIFLASLPLVTIDQITSQAANQAPGLLVFPCLSTPGAQSAIAPGVVTSALLQVIQIAAGYAWRPLILALDVPSLPLALNDQTQQNASEQALDSFPKETEWLQALTQYLHTAGLRGSIGRCWQEVLQQLESHSVDVLLLCWTDAVAQTFTAPMLSAIQQLPKRPPILVLDHRNHHQAVAADSIAPLPEVLKHIATIVLPASLPMPELLSQIHQAMKATKR